MKKMKLLTSMILTLVLIVSLMPTAMAAKEATIDPDTTTGKITITLKRTDGETLVSNVNVTLHQVGTGSVENSNLYFDLLDVLKGTQVGDANVTLDGLNADQNTANAAALKTAIGKLSAEDQAEVPTWTVKTGEDGKAEFGDLSVGVYLVQSEKRGGYQAITPFLIYLPMTVTEEDGSSSYWETDVAASPKVSYSSGGGGGGGITPTIPEEELPDDPVPTGGKEPSEEPGEELEDPDVPMGGLPQTGLLQWPIPVMTAAGLLLVALGLGSERKRKANN